MDNLLRSIYYDISNPASFGGVQRLWEAAREKDPGISREDVDEWLRGETVYTLHRQARYRYKHNPVVSHCIGEWCQADLTDVIPFANENDGYGYLLTFIDVFSRKATAVPLRSKEAVEVAAAFDRIFEKFICFNLLVDRGTEFRNGQVQAVMKKHGCRMVFAYNESVKASVVERFNRTLKERLFKYMTLCGSRRYIDVLDAVVRSYNQSVHSRHGLRPDEVSAANTKLVFERSFGQSGAPERARFKIGDLVRIKYALPVMSKGYYPRFTDQVYTVSGIIPGHPRTMYMLKDWIGKQSPRMYYSEDLLRVTGRTKYRIEKVLKRVGNRCFVKWIGYPPEASTWIRNPSHLASR